MEELKEYQKMEQLILDNINYIAKSYTCSRNLIKNINKRNAELFIILSCEPAPGGAWKVIKVKDFDNREFRFKMLESENGVEFKMWNAKTNVMQVDLIKIIKEKGTFEFGLDNITIHLTELDYEEHQKLLEVIRK